VQALSRPEEHRRQLGCIAVAVLTLLLGGTGARVRAAEPSGSAQEITGFRMTGYEGYFSLRYLGDHFGTRQPDYGTIGSVESRQVQTDLRSELFVMTHSYVYHPKLLALDVGGGVVFDDSSSEFDGQSSRARQPLYNLSVHANLLSDKPYRGTVYFEHLNPTVSVSPAEILTQQSQKVGASVSLLAPVSPVPVTIEASRSQNKGSSTLRVVDDETDRVVVVADRSLGKLGQTHLHLESQQQASSSGSPNLPIQQSRLNARTISLDTQLRLGDQREHEISNTISSLEQEYSLEQGPSPKSQNLRFTANYRGVTSPQTQSLAAYSFNHTKQDAFTTDVNSANITEVWTPSKDLSATAGLRGDSTRASQFGVSTWGVDGSAVVEQALPLGIAQISYAAQYDARSQTATSASTAIVGERVVLTGTQAAPLTQARVVPGSVVVSNAVRTQVFVEGIDYRLTVVGLTTRLERLLGGSLIDGETVLVDYAFDFGGSFDSTQFSQNLNLNWAVLPRWSIYLRFSDAMPRVTAGTPTSPLNTVHSRLIGSRAEVPLSLAAEIQVGGFIEQENRQETISPYVRTEGELFVQGELYPLYNADFRLAAHRTTIAADNVFQASKLTGLNMALGWRTGMGLRLLATALFERDTGGIELRERRTGTLRATWQFRRLTLTADLMRSRELQGGVVRDRSVGSIVLRRDFSS
jgi:hypothetical protein